MAAGFSDVDAIDQWPVLSGATEASQRTELWVDTHVCRLWLLSSNPLEEQSPINLLRSSI